MAKTKRGCRMKNNLRGIIQGCCLIGIFVGFLFIDGNIKVGATVSLGSMILFLLLEKGVL